MLQIGGCCKLLLHDLLHNLKKTYMKQRIFAGSNPALPTILLSEGLREPKGSLFCCPEFGLSSAGTRNIPTSKGIEVSVTPSE